MSEVSVGSASAKPGDKARGFLKIGETPYGTPVELPINIINGTKPGKKLWVQSAIHPTEWTGSMALLRVINDLDPNTMKGTLIAVPVVNTAGFGIIAGRSSPYDRPVGRHRLGFDMNRVWPGDSEGSFAHQAVAIIFEQIIKVADYLIDFHAAGNPRTKWNLYIKDDTETAIESKRFCEAFGWEVMVGTKNPLLARSTAIGRFMEHGIPSFIVEAGGAKKWLSDEAVNWSYEGIMNALKYLKIIKGTPKKPEWSVHCSEHLFHQTPETLGKGAQLRSKAGGIVWSVKEPMEKVSKGETISKVYNIWGEVVEEIKSPVDGIILTIYRLPSANGLSAAQIGILP